MKAPVMQREVAITAALADQNIIYLYATPDAASDFQRFGQVEPWAHPDYYQITVDARYDFAEVVAYIKSYGAAA